MSLQTWLDNGWLKAHESSPQEVANYLALADRDLKDAMVDRLSADWRLGIAYNAALQLATLALAAEGYRPVRDQKHRRSILSLEQTIGADKGMVYTLDTVRQSRNKNNYDLAGTTSTSEAEEVYDLAVDLKKQVIDWMQREHPELLLR